MADEIVSSVTESTLSHEELNTMHFEWNFNNFFSLPIDFNKSFDSPFFSFSKGKWCIRIYTNGSISGTIGFVGLFRVKNCRTFHSFLNVEFFFKRSNCSFREKKTLELYFSNEEPFWGFNKYLRRTVTFESRDSLLPNDVLTVHCSIHLKHDISVVFAIIAPQTMGAEGFKKLSQDITEVFTGGVKGDVKFQVKDKVFEAHRLVLCARSSVFRVMFETDMKEKNDGIIDIVDANPSDFEDFLVFTYSGRLKIVSKNNAVGLYYLADKYNLCDLKRACCQHLIEEISVDSVLDSILLSSVHEESELLESATEFFIKHADTIFVTPKWLSFLSDHLTLANEFLVKMAKNYVKP